MTKHPIEVPRLGESISEATIGQLLVPTGTVVKAQQEIVELETEKVNQLLYAPADGVISWSVKTGDNVPTGGQIGFIETQGAGTAAAVSAPQAAKEATTTRQEQPKVSLKAPDTAGLRMSKEETAIGLQKQADRPAAPRPQEAIVEAPVEPVEVPQPARKPVEASQKNETRVRLSRVRQVIATRLVESQRATATLTTFNEVDMSAVMELRTLYKEDFTKRYAAKLGFLSFFVTATVSALRAYPGLNSYIDGDELVQRHDYDIGVAVGTDRGLLVPVVRGCDRLSFVQIEKTIESLAKRGREGTLTVDELQGGGFTITNGGVYGSLLSTPILNRPQSGILGMHKIADRPIAVDKQVVIRPMMYLALSYDHRVVDGKEAVSFLVHIKNCLEDPARMLLQI